ncbi:hypothetical protein G4B88_024726 [Cannabis sativa]|uniref:Uncharacterized protein n=1 Tax=Cannabis sativa TaxID=3483 RepID=A0A7J6GW34_CANSA|nr:hypothetical protein G4B88_024726 [Cannabis sativa]
MFIEERELDQQQEDDYLKKLMMRNITTTENINNVRTLDLELELGLLKGHDLKEDDNDNVLDLELRL